MKPSLLFRFSLLSFAYSAMSMHSQAKSSQAKPSHLRYKRYISEALSSEDPPKIPKTTLWRRKQQSNDGGGTSIEQCSSLLSSQPAMSAADPIIFNTSEESVNISCDSALLPDSGQPMQSENVTDCEPVDHIHEDNGNGTDSGGVPFKYDNVFRGNFKV